MACWVSKKLKQKKSYFLIALLSLNDLAIGVLGNPAVVVLIVKTLLKTKFNECATFILIQLVASCLIAISSTTLFLLNLERYLCIAHPFFHRNKVTKLRICATALVLWMLAILPVLSRLFMETTTRYLKTLTIIISIVLSGYMYTYIFHASRKTARVGRSRLNWTARNIVEYKLAKSCAVVVCCAIVCFIPVSVTGLLKAEGDAVVFAVAFWSQAIVFAGSSGNSVVFFWRNGDLKHEAKKLLKCTKHRMKRNPTRFLKVWD